MVNWTSTNSVKQRERERKKQKVFWLVFARLVIHIFNSMQTAPLAMEVAMFSNALSKTHL